MKTLLQLGLWLFLMQPVGAWAQDVGIVAVVEDTIVSSTDVKNRLALMALSTGKTLTPQMAKALQPQAIQSLIDERLYLQEARKQRITISEDEINRAIRSIEVKNNLAEGKIDTLLGTHHIPRAALDEQIKAQLVWSKIVAKEIQPKIKISDAEVKEAMEHVTNRGGEKEFLMSEIVLPIKTPKDEAAVKAQAERIIREARAGSSFAKLAAQYSASQSKQNGGRVGWIKETAIPPLALAQLAGLKPEGVTDPIRTDKAYYILQAHQQREALTALQYETKISLKQVFVPLSGTAGNKEGEAAANKLQQLAEKISTCQSFDSVIRQAMPGTSTEAIPLTIRDVHPDLQGALATLNVGDKPAVVRSSIGVHLLAVCERSRPATVETKAADDAQIREALTQQKVELQARHYLRNLRRNAMIEMRM